MQTKAQLISKLESITESSNPEWEKWSLQKLSAEIVRLTSNDSDSDEDNGFAKRLEGSWKPR
jgi:hypothetical protein